MLTGKINPSINSSKIYRSNRTIFEGALTVAEVVISTSRKAKGRDGKGNQSLPQRLRVVIFVSPRINPPARFLARRTVTYLQRFYNMQSESHAPRRLLTRASISRDIPRPRYFVKQSRVINPTILPFSFKKNKNNRRREGKLGFDPSALNFNILIRSRYRYISSLTLRISIP